jgi:hypothetical protein
MPPDAAQIRGRIISLIRDNGPSLPVQVAKDTGLSILFASAFLSELYGDKIINISNLRVGSSPLYFIPGQEPQLERFSQYVKGKEKEAYLLLKERKILKDSELQPAIRVALREIKDFAIPFEKNNEIFWRYFLIEEPSDFAEERSEINKRDREQEKIEIDIIEIKEEEPVEEENEKIEISEDKLISPTGGREGISEKISEQISKKEKPIEDIFKKEKHPKKLKSETKIKKSGKNEKKDDNFFNTIKEFLSKKEIEIIDIKDFKNNQALLKVKKNNQEELLFVFNKKRISEKEILNAHKTASEEKMPYSILSLGETTKKLNDLISAIKNLSSIDKIE